MAITRSKAVGRLARCGGLCVRWAGQAPGSAPGYQRGGALAPHPDRPWQDATVEECEAGVCGILASLPAAGARSDVCIARFAAYCDSTSNSFWITQLLTLSICICVYSFESSVNHQIHQHVTHPHSSHHSDVCTGFLHLSSKGVAPQYCQRKNLQVSQPFLT